MNVELIRHAYLPQATLGTLIAGNLRLATLEERWLADPHGPGGQRREAGVAESCVPDGEYDLVPHTGAKQRDVWALVNPELGVWHWPGEIPKGQPWGRSAVLIHVGNTTADIEGCILAGLRHDPRELAVRESGAAIEKLRAVLGTMARHRIRIRPTAGTSEQP